MVSAAIAAPLSISILEGCGQLPLVIQPGGDNHWRPHFQAIESIIDQNLDTVGGVLLRGFEVSGDRDFQAFARAFGHDLLSYDYGSTPRTKVEGGVYTSTEYPAHQIIPLHNEQAYTLQWPLKIWFHCVKSAEQDGETPIADSRLVYEKIDPAIRERFSRKQLMYVRNYGNGLDLSWQQAFNTEERSEVEQFCRNNQIELQWKEDGELRTRQISQSVAQHPRTGESVWFNQAHLFHVSNLQPHVRETLVSVVGEENLPRHVYFGDGSPIDEADLKHIRSVLDECQIKFPWQEGDILMLDNMLAAHGRSTFKGERKVIVAMAEPNK